MGYNLFINRVYGGYNPLTNPLQTSWDIQVLSLQREDDLLYTWGANANGQLGYGSTNGGRKWKDVGCDGVGKSSCIRKG